MIVEAKTGAGGAVAAEAVARSDPDGYALLMAGTNHATISYLYRSLAFNPVADFAPVTLICTQPSIMIVPNSSPAKSVADFIAYAKANKGKITYASAGNGTAPHLYAELFKRMTGIEMTHVPYRGGPPAHNDLIPGRVDVMFSLLTAVQLVRAGQVRGLAVTSAARFSAVPELPTVAEAGVPGFEASSWWALFAPSKTPTEIVSTIYAAAAAALADPMVKKRMDQLGTTVVGSTPGELAEHLSSEMDRWRRVIKEANIKIDG